MREPRGTAEVIADRIIDDLKDRSGFEFFDELFEEVQNEILETWAGIIGEYLRNPRLKPDYLTTED